MVSCCGCILNQSTFTPMEKLLKKILNFDKVSILEYKDKINDTTVLEQLDKEFCLFIERTIIVVEAKECVYKHIDNIERLLSQIDTDIGKYLSVKLRFIMSIIVMRWGVFIDMGTIEDIIDCLETNISNNDFLDYIHKLYACLN